MEEEVKIRKRINARFVIDQKEESILLHIKNIFNCGNVNNTGVGDVYRYSNGSLKANQITVDYFNKFCLKTKKQRGEIKLPWQKNNPGGRRVGRSAGVVERMTRLELATLTLAR